MQPISDAAAAAFAANPAPEQNLASAPTVDRPMPRLGRGIVWSKIVAEIEADQAARELPPLPVPTTPAGPGRDQVSEHEFGTAVLRLVDGVRVVEHADPLVLVSKELLIEATGESYVDGVLTLDTAGEYRYRRLRTHDQHADVFERIEP